MTTDLLHLSAVCASGLAEFCSDASCENPVHDTEDLEPMDESCPDPDTHRTLYAARETTWRPGQRAAETKPGTCPWCGLRTEET